VESALKIFTEVWPGLGVISGVEVGSMVGVSVVARTGVGVATIG